MTTQTITTWRTSRPYDRDVVGLQIIKYEMDDNDSPHAFVLVLEPEPHWQEYGEGYNLPNTLEFSGHDMRYLIGMNTKTTDVDPRIALEAMIDERVKVAVAAVMELHPAVEFTEAT